MNGPVPGSAASRPCALFRIDRQNSERTSANLGLRARILWGHTDLGQAILERWRNDSGMTLFRIGTSNIEYLVSNGSSLQFDLLPARHTPSPQSLVLLNRRHRHHPHILSPGALHVRPRTLSRALLYVL